MIPTAHRFSWVVLTVAVGWSAGAAPSPVATGMVDGKDGVETLCAGDAASGTPTWEVNAGAVGRLGTPSHASPEPDRATAPMPDDGIAPGVYVTVAITETALRAGPDCGADLIATLARGTRLLVIGPAETRDGIVWWPVESLARRRFGFVEAGAVTRESR